MQNLLKLGSFSLLLFVFSTKLVIEAKPWPSPWPEIRGPGNPGRIFPAERNPSNYEQNNSPLALDQDGKTDGELDISPGVSWSYQQEDEGRILNSPELSSFFPGQETGANTEDVEELAESDSELYSQDSPHFSSKSEPTSTSIKFQEQENEEHSGYKYSPESLFSGENDDELITLTRSYPEHPEEDAEEKPGMTLRNLEKANKPLFLFMSFPFQPSSSSSSFSRKESHSHMTEEIRESKTAGGSIYFEPRSPFPNPERDLNLNPTARVKQTVDKNRGQMRTRTTTSNPEIPAEAAAADYPTAPFFLQDEDQDDSPVSDSPPLLLQFPSPQLELFNQAPVTEAEDQPDILLRQSPEIKKSDKRTDKFQNFKNFYTGPLWADKKRKFPGEKGEFESFAEIQNDARSNSDVDVDLDDNENPRISSSHSSDMSWAPESSARSNSRMDGLFNQEIRFQSSPFLISPPIIPRERDDDVRLTPEHAPPLSLVDELRGKIFNR